MKRRSGILRKKNVKHEARRARTRGFLKFFCLLSLTAGAVLAGREALRRLEFFALKQVVVLGNPQTLSEAEVIQRSGLKLKTNLFQVPLEEVQMSLKEHPFFKSVIVQRQIPSTVVITVKEFHPEFLLNTGRFYYVDFDGDIFKDVTATDDKRDFPVLSGISEADILSEPLKIREAIRQAAQLKEAYRHSEFFQNFGLSEVAWEKNIGFTLYPEKKKYSIKFGLKDFTEKVKKLEDFWRHLEKSQAKVSSIDLNYPGKILMTL